MEEELEVEDEDAEDYTEAEDEMEAEEKVKMGGREGEANLRILGRCPPL